MNVSSGRTLLREGIPTLPEVMQAGGYRTGIFGKWHLGDNFPYRPQDRGFERARWFPSSHITSAPDRWENDYFDTWLRTDERDVRQFEGYSTDILFDLALDWIDECATGGDPFLAFLPLNAVHIPLLVEDKYRRPYADLDRDLATLFGMVVNIDDNVGRLDQALRRLGIRDNTIVIYMSDNGGSGIATDFYNAGMRGRKTDLWDGGHRVPCFVRWPRAGLGGSDAGRDVDVLTTAQDIMPTLIELCDLAGPATASDGVSLAGLLTSAEEDIADRMVVVQYSRIPRPRPEKGDAAVLWGKWRLVEGEHLFDVGSDPGQQEDVAASHPDVVAAMLDHYEKWWAGVEDLANELGEVVVGDEKENPVLLAPPEWRDSFLDQSSRVRAGQERNGVWGVRVAQSGAYRFELRRWPAESGLAIRSPAPEFHGGDCVYPAGKALEISRARLRVGEVDVSADVDDSTKAAEFDVDLEPGSTTIQTWFESADGRELCGAYYVYAERISGS